jgi:hypothetical protein
MKTKRKSRGYWDEFMHVERELRAFIDDNGVPDRMPTSGGLNAAGRNDLVRAKGFAR